MVLRRYTPPTCTLEITAKTSPLSFWAGQAVLKSLRFELRLDDPRLPEEKHITLRGDRTQLELLHEVVSDYVQDFLMLSPTEERESIPTPPPETHSPRPPQPIILDESYNPYAIDTKGANSPVSTSPFPVPSPTETPHPSTLTTISHAPYLQPNGLLGHDLFLGSLSNGPSGAVVHLSILQLFDLATALDEYADEVIALPNLKRDRSRNASPVWLSAVAMVLVAVGLTTWELFQRHPQNSPLDLQIAIKPPGQSPLASPTSPVPKMGIQSVATPIPTASPAMTKPQLPPPPVGAASPSPKLPTVSVSPSPFAKPSPIPPPTPVFPPPGPTLANPESAIAIPGSAEPMPLPPSPSTPLPSPTRVVLRTAPPAEPLRVAPPPPLAPETPVALGDIVPKVTGPTELPPLEDSQATPTPEESPQKVAVTPQNRTLFDTIPQVAEARSYFQERWQPPADLKEPLEYTLQLDANGSIQRITPLGQAAGDYIDRTNMPLPGEAFVSAVAEGKSPRIRLVLRPSGKVQTFLEALE